MHLCLLVSTIKDQMIDGRQKNCSTIEAGDLTRESDIPMRGEMPNARRELLLAKVD
jgi:hypothetical protein